MASTEQDFENDILPDLDDSHDDSEKELAVFGGELDTLKGNILNNINKERSTKDKQEAENNLITQLENPSKDNKKTSIQDSKKDNAILTTTMIWASGLRWYAITDPSIIGRTNAANNVIGGLIENPLPWTNFLQKLINYWTDRLS